MIKDIKIWGIVEGPISVKDLPDNDYPEGVKWFHECKVEVDGEIIIHPYWFYSLNEANEMKKYFNTNIEPLQVKINYGELYDA